MSSTESESEKSERFHSSDCDSVAYYPVKTKLSESEAEAEEPKNQKARNRAL